MNGDKKNNEIDQGKGGPGAGGEVEGKGRLGYYGRRRGRMVNGEENGRMRRCGGEGEEHK